MFSKVYIIGKIPEHISVATQKKFSDAQKKLEKFNVEVYNPVEAFLPDSTSKEEALKQNISQLMKANAVYVLNEFNPSENNIEIMLAMKLNVLIMHEV